MFPSSENASLFAPSSSLLLDMKQTDNPNVAIRTATLKDLIPEEKAKVSRLLRRVLELSQDNARLTSAAASASASEAATVSEEALRELRSRLDAALDAMQEARLRAEVAEARLEAARGSCVCGAVAGAAAGGRGGGEAETTTRSDSCERHHHHQPASARQLVFNEATGNFEFSSSDVENESRHAVQQQQPLHKQQQQPRAVPVDKRASSSSRGLQDIVAQVEATLAAASSHGYNSGRRFGTR